MATQKIIKGKKKWFTVVAPEIFKSKELVDITAYNPEELKGRLVEISMAQITGSPKDMQRKIVFKIFDTRGEKVLTTSSKYFMIESFIQRSGRRYKERFIHVLKIPSKDGKTLEIKWLAMGVKKLHHPIRAALLNKITEQAKEIFAKYNAEDIFLPINLDKISDEVRKATRTIYPMDKLLVYKLKVL